MISTFDLFLNYFHNMPLSLIAYYGAAEPPFRFELSHLSEKIEPVFQKESHPQISGSK
jgi:hypothetical protein